MMVKTVPEVKKFHSILKCKCPHREGGSKGRNSCIDRILCKTGFWFKSRLSEFQKRSLLVVNEAFEILSNEELGQKAGFSKDSDS
ncbi:MAG: hypothetical protein AAF620_04160 [Bacteroidota bacterium]